MDAPNPLPPPDEIRRLAQEIVHRSVYDLGPSGDDVPVVVRILRVLRKIFGPIYDWFEALWIVSPILAAVLLVILFAVLLALIWHIVYSFRSAMRAPAPLKSGFETGTHALTPAELEQRARIAGKNGDYIEAVRLLFMASLLSLESAQKRTVRRGTTNREYLQRFKNSPAFEPLFFFVDTLDRKWYAGVACTESDYQESLRAYASIRQTAAVTSGSNTATEAHRAKLP
jgi:hypothetical protein